VGTVEGNGKTDEFHVSYSFCNVSYKNEMGGEYSTHGRDKKCINFFGLEMPMAMLMLIVT